MCSSHSDYANQHNLTLILWETNHIHIKIHTRSIIYIMTRKNVHQPVLWNTRTCKYAHTPIQYKSNISPDRNCPPLAKRTSTDLTCVASRGYSYQTSRSVHSNEARSTDNFHLVKRKSTAESLHRSHPIFLSVFKFPSFYALLNQITFLLLILISPSFFFQHFYFLFLYVPYSSLFISQLLFFFPPFVFIRHLFLPSFISACHYSSKGFVFHAISDLFFLLFFFPSTEHVKEL